MIILGWIVYLLFSLGVIITPIGVVAISPIGGGLKRGEAVYCFALFCLGCFLFYHCISISPFELSVK